MASHCNIHRDNYVRPVKMTSGRVSGVHNAYGNIYGSKDCNTCLPSLPEGYLGIRISLYRLLFSQFNSQLPWAE